MKFSLSWLKAHLETDANAAQVADTLTRIGLEVEGVDTEKLFGWLWNKHRIRTTPIMHAEFKGLRITPSIYTTPAEIDVFVDVMKKAAKVGIA